MPQPAMLKITDLCKSFTLHTQGGVRIPVLDHTHLTVRQGECVMLYGPSGAGKSTLLQSIYASYKPQAGAILARHNGTWVDMLRASPQRIRQVRMRTMGYVSQFLRVIPRVPALDVVSEPLRVLGVEREEARQQAEVLLERLNIPRRLWEVAPATFSGGEQQRINIARGFVYTYPILLLDEPTASLEDDNRAVVIELIRAALRAGTAIVGISHDEQVRNAIGTRLYNLTMQEIA